jgi:hypothetical protein
MARSRHDAPDDLSPERRSPLAVTVGLAVVFLLLLGIGVVTVLIPELSDDADEETQAAEDAPAEGSPSEGPSPSAPSPGAAAGP